MQDEVQKTQVETAIKLQLGQQEVGLQTWL